ncbi:MAG TPA: response regulator receiver protein [Microvirga sp.]|jgi:pilus assembly protein CpaE|nr:response regulator receiver protein [Microvirga sp.]
MVQDAPTSPPTIVLVGPDAGHLNAIAAALTPMTSVKGLVIPESIEQAVRRQELDAAAVVVVDLDSKRRESLMALQGLTARIAGTTPVIVLTDAFDDALMRWFLQIRVADFLRKPVDPKEVLRACVRALRATVEGPGGTGQILSFMAAAGGVGATTLAVEAAMILARETKTPDSTCLVDLDFQTSACADYLDLEPRLDLDEIGSHPDRLDMQLLEVMFTRHKSGLALVAAKGRPAEGPALDTGVVLRILDLVSSRFENVVIDMPRAWMPWTDQVLMGSTHVFIVTDMTVPGLRFGRRAATSLSGRLSDVRPRVIVNRFEQQMLFGTGLRRADVERALEGFLEGTVSNNYKLVREAIDRGLPLDDIKAGSNVSTDLRKIIFNNRPAE